MQHPTGGVIGELRVHDRDTVHAGDVQLRLDETVTHADLAALENNLSNHKHGGESGSGSALRLSASCVVMLGGAGGCA